eukprot:364027-Chlamydomonas_euryale.AAC.13
MGPYVATVQSISTPPAPDTRPAVGLRPTTPQNAAGMRIEPPPSVPTAIGHSPAATAAAEPDDEPPVYACTPRPTHGLTGVPVRTFRPVTPSPISCMLALPRSTAPRPCSAATSGEDAATGRDAARNDVPAVVAYGSASMTSLTQNGTPSSGRARPSA